MRMSLPSHDFIMIHSSKSGSCILWGASIVISVDISVDASVDLSVATRLIID